MFLSCNEMGSAWVRGEKGGGRGTCQRCPQAIRDGEGDGGVEGCTLFARVLGPETSTLYNYILNITTFLQKRLFQCNMIIRANPVIVYAVERYRLGQSAEG